MACTTSGSGVSSWQLTVDGESKMEVAWVLTDKVSATEPRATVALSAMTVWEWAEHLRRKGWSHQVWPWRYAPDAVVIVKESPKVWYVKPGASTSSHMTLLTLS